VKQNYVKANFPHIAETKSAFLPGTHPPNSSANQINFHSLRKKEFQRLRVPFGLVWS